MAKLKFNKKKIITVIKKIILWFFISTIAVSLIYRFVPPPVTPLMLVRYTGQLFSGEKVRLSKDWVKLDDISPNLVNAVVASEDNNFKSHWGFDFEAIKKANELNKKGGRLRGASTITQQTAKNVFLWPDRTYVRKGFEVYFTILIEFTWSKRRTMEVYLNVIEMGKGIYGAEQAAQTYFHKSAKNLNKREAAAIAAILPNPRKWHPDKPTAYIQHKTQKIMEAMDRIGPVSFK